ncbi:unnamed protein product [Vicia faba]|uniref:Uncharacterized protein n=1 Tax=Vicia faba TaxID=3906 RepID=A0AAV1A226_VICFA|nr:unnamed protein product [Vicia faba]
MASLSGFRNHLGTPTISIHITCLRPYHDWKTKSNHPNQVICFKTKKQEELSTNSKNIIKNIYKVMHGHLKKTKKQEDDKCLWKKTILMGEKCQPLEFSGAIFYDSEGNQLSEPPRTPRISPLLSLGKSMSQIN